LIRYEERVKNGTSVDFTIIAVDGIQKWRRQRIKNPRFWTIEKCGQRARLGISQNQLDFSRNQNIINTFGTFENGTSSFLQRNFENQRKGRALMPLAFRVALLPAMPTIQRLPFAHI
jgi:hypothetical protein